MTLSAISHYRGGTIDVVAPLAKKLKAAYFKHGIAYRLSRFETGQNVGDWFVVVQYADQRAYEKAQIAIAQDPECQQAFVEIAKFAKRISILARRPTSQAIDSATKDCNARAQPAA
jgi:hypothetical protein